MRKTEEEYPLKIYALVEQCPPHLWWVLLELIKSDKLDQHNDLGVAYQIKYLMPDPLRQLLTSYTGGTVITKLSHLYDFYATLAED